MEPQVQEHQVRDVGDDSLGILQRSHPLAHHLGSDHLVVMEAHPPAAGFVASSRGFADVVEQCRPAQDQVGIALLEVDRLLQDGQRMLVDVLVLVVLVDGELHPGGDLRHHPLRQARIDHRVDRVDRELTADELVQLGADTFGGDAVDLSVHLGDGLPHARREPESELGDEADGTQHPQRIVAEGLLRCRRGGVDDTGQQRGHPVERIAEVLGAPPGTDTHGHRVDGEVAADEIVFEGLAEGDLRIAADLVVRVGAECGDLDLVVALADADRAELDPDIPERVRPPP